MRFPRNYRHLDEDEVSLAFQVYMHSIRYGRLQLSDGIG